MRKLLVICVLFCCSLHSVLAQVNINDLTRKDNKWLKSQKLFTGDFVAYYPDGKIKEKGSFKNGVYNGTLTSYFESGSKSQEQTYINGKLNGESFDYFESGKIRGRFQYKNDLADGKTSIYYESGVKRAESDYDQKTKMGTYYEYNEQGKLIDQFETVDGQQTISTRYGKKIPILSAEAVEFSNSGKYREAIALYDEIVAINPTIATVYFNRGAAKGMVFNIDGAILDYNEAIELSPDYKEAYANRGVAKINQYTTKGIINPTPAQCQSACEDLYKAKELGAGAEVEDMIYVYCEKNNIKPADSASKGKLPFFIIDGHIGDQSLIGKTNPQDILQVEVLKDKTATEKFGKAGANGVFIITTIKFAILAYQKILSDFSDDYNKAISKTGDSDFKYVVNGEILDENEHDTVRKLYLLKAVNIESVQYNPAKGLVTIKTKN
jgi:antitoxin component YwqK of YwqJK toxin-antitoxin module